MKPAPTKRHVVSIMRPSTTLDPRGQVTGPDTQVAGSVYASVEYLNGRELEIARQIEPDVSMRIRFFVSESWALKTSDFLLYRGSRVGIGYISYKEDIRLEATCLCQEEPSA